MVMSTAPLANTITLGVRDFVGQRDFYRNLGWSLAFDSEDFAVFELRGVLLALFPLDKLAADAKSVPEVSSGGIRCAVIISVAEPHQVDEIVERARQAGARITKGSGRGRVLYWPGCLLRRPRGQFLGGRVGPSDNPVVIAAHRAAGLAS